MSCGTMDYLEAIYNFAYRLSGNTHIAEELTENVLIQHPTDDEALLLRRTWLCFQNDYGCMEFKGEGMLQQAILSLEPVVRCSVILHDILGCSYSRIAVILQKTEAEVKGLVASGRMGIMQACKK